MVGLSVVLESHKGSSSSSIINNNKKIPQVINKTTMNMTMFSTSSCSINQQLSPPSHHSPPFRFSTFLDQCFLCNKRLLPGKDIYMYKGDTAFCSVDCRCKQILKDEEEAIQKENRSLDACHQRKGARNKPGGVAY